VDVNDETDEKGWIYSERLKAYIGWSKSDEKANYRRRRHIRFRSPIPNSIPLPYPDPTKLNDMYPITILVQMKEISDVKIKTPLVLMLVHRKVDKKDTEKTEKSVVKQQHSRTKIIEGCKGSANFHQIFYFQLLASDEVEVRLLMFGLTSDEIVGSLMISAGDLVASCGQDMEVDWSKGKVKCKSKLIIQPQYFETESKY
jgi:hypothetical protein